MKVFVFEFVTGGGFAGQPLPPFLGDGEAMWRALMDDLTALDGVEVITLRDDRLPAPDDTGAEIVYTHAQRFEEDYRRCLEAADAVWPVAPEGDGLLERVSRDILASGKRLLGSGIEALQVAASKHATAQTLAALGRRVPETFTSPFHMPVDGAVVAKPDDGAGCQETYLFEHLQAAQDWSSHHDGQAFTYQYYVPGQPMSLSMLCCEGKAQLLSVNRQHVELQQGRFHAHGVTVNDIADSDGRYGLLARQIAEALPDLWGYVGVDFIAADDGPQVLEINPRLTLSYAGLRAATGTNTARRVLDLPVFTPCWGLRAVPVAAHTAPACVEVAA